MKLLSNDQKELQDMVAAKLRPVPEARDQRVKLDQILLIAKDRGLDVEFNG